MKKLFSVLVFCCCFLGLAQAQQAPAQFPNIDAFVENGMKEWRIPGMSLAIIKDGKVVYAKGYGVREVGKPDKVDENTIFAIGSNTKAFTATAMHQLADQNKLSLDDKVTKFLPDFKLYDPVATENVTIRDVISHRYGLGTWHGDFVAYGSKYTTDELIYKMRFIKPASAFRSSYGYTNVGFATAGAVLSKLTNQSWQEYIKTNFLTPLGMNRTSTSVTELPNYQNVAAPHTIHNDKLVAVPYRNIDGIAAAGALNSSAVDLAKWITMQLNQGTLNGKTIVKPEIIKATHYPNIALQVPPYGNPVNPANHFAAYASGWRTNDYQGRIMIAHGGGVDGMTSQTVFLPEEQLGIVIMTNTDANNFCTALLYQIIDAYLGTTPKKDWQQQLFAIHQKAQQEEKEKWAKLERERNKNAKPSLALKNYTGLYRNEHYGDARVTLEKGKLKLTLLGHENEVGTLENWEKDTFLCRWNDPVFDKGIVPFTVDGKSATGFKLTVRPEFLDPLEYEFKKVE
ncbi:serine hydrolase [Rufibacter roseus]|uniref:Serine hydrolase n=1 Tax=Rufibacter roseus TaxID=1567108 RepID=A0ABW2DHX7_9BACT|nr:serine hydrolase [Rufibacter roseus]